jgi:RNA polymerase sigma-70 factor (family 1)
LNNSGTTEPELVKALSKGEIKAFNDLFQLYGNRIFRFALGYLKSELDTEELVQDVFLKVWERRQEIKENLSFKAYIFTIAFNIIRKHFVKKALTTRYFEQQVIKDIDLSTVQDIDFQSTKNNVYHIIDQLPPRRKEVFIKSRFEGLTVKEIAGELGTTPKTVENQLGEALKFIRGHLVKEDLAGILFFMLFFS